jgi:hypothetical protein
LRIRAEGNHSAITWAAQKKGTQIFLWRVVRNTGVIHAQARRNTSRMEGRMQLPTGAGIEMAT